MSIVHVVEIWSMFWPCGMGWVKRLKRRKELLPEQTREDWRECKYLSSCSTQMLTLLSFHDKKSNICTNTNTNTNTNICQAVPAAQPNVDLAQFDEIQAVFDKSPTLTSCETDTIQFAN